MLCMSYERKHIDPASTGAGYNLECLMKLRAFTGAGYNLEHLIKLCAFTGAGYNLEHLMSVCVCVCAYACVCSLFARRRLASLSLVTLVAPRLAAAQGPNPNSVFWRCDG
jgi:hypothetical protein